MLATINIAILALSLLGVNLSGMLTTTMAAEANVESGTAGEPQ